ncbi:ATP-grasp domain-containing protein [Corynebacterium lizhenjunii]|uniref:ATP-grasp domain-containing protein n=1 Tax=Corynebacterium lizhenjunii TaxID=2709394 RepID=A0A7T0KEE9_9CORY|nr:ATP-grasp domain-containing protein [Corynebacterium lizhenjunii]QPK79281.1 ATP-grasp domain-containing protein [Corynebacterium lizhenjunii]
MIFYILEARKAIMEAAQSQGGEGIAVVAPGADHHDLAGYPIIEVADAKNPLLVAQALAGVAESSPQRQMCIGLGDDTAQCALMVNTFFGWEVEHLPNFTSLESMRDKHRLRCTLGPGHRLNGQFWTVSADAAAATCTPDATPTSTSAVVVQLLESCPNGVVLKPNRGSGSRDVLTVRDKAQAHSVELTGESFLAEELFFGPEFSVEGLSWDGQYFPLVVTQKTTGGATGLVETGQLQPARIGKQETMALFAAAEEVLAAVGYRFGLSHIEFILSATGPKLIEAHGRVGGDRIADMMRWSIGATAFEILFQTYVTGQGPQLADAPACHPSPQEAAIRFVDMTGWKGTDEQWRQRVAACPGVQEAVVLKPAGQRGLIGKSADRHAHVLVAGDDASAILRAVEEALG